MCFQPRDPSRRDALEEGVDAWAGEPMLYHVAYVEEGGMRACEVVRGADAEGCVLNRHVEAAKWHHLAAVREVEVVEGRLAQDFIIRC